MVLGANDAFNLLIHLLFVALDCDLLEHLDHRALSETRQSFLQSVIQLQGLVVLAFHLSRFLQGGLKLLSEILLSEFLFISFKV